MNCSTSAQEDMLIFTTADNGSFSSSTAMLTSPTTDVTPSSPSSTPAWTTTTSSHNFGGGSYDGDSRTLIDAEDEQAISSILTYFAAILLPIGIQIMLCSCMISLYQVLMRRRRKALKLQMKRQNGGSSSTDDTDDNTKLKLGPRSSSSFNSLSSSGAGRGGSISSSSHLRRHRRQRSVGGRSYAAAKSGSNGPSSAWAARGGSTNNPSFSIKNWFLQKLSKQKSRLAGSAGSALIGSVCANCGGGSREGSFRSLPPTSPDRSVGGISNDQNFIAGGSRSQQSPEVIFGTCQSCRSPNGLEKIVEEEFIYNNTTSITINDDKGSSNLPKMTESSDLVGVGVGEGLLLKNDRWSWGTSSAPARSGTLETTSLSTYPPAKPRNAPTGKASECAVFILMPIDEVNTKRKVKKEVSFELDDVHL